MKIRHCFWIVVQQNNLKKKTNETGLDKNDGTLEKIENNLTIGTC